MPARGTNLALRRFPLHGVNFLAADVPGNDGRAVWSDPTPRTEVGLEPLDSIQSRDLFDLAVRDADAEHSPVFAEVSIEINVFPIGRPSGIGNRAKRR